MIIFFRSFIYVGRLVLLGFIYRRKMGSIDIENNCVPKGAIPKITDKHTDCTYIELPQPNKNLSGVETH